MAKRKLNKALKAKVRPDSALASIIGSTPIPRSDILKKLWAYFRKHKLNSGRTIKLDAKLKASGIWGRASSIDMTEVGRAFSHAG